MVTLPATRILKRAIIVWRLIDQMRTSHASRGWLEVVTWYYERSGWTFKKVEVACICTPPSVFRDALANFRKVMLCVDRKNASWIDSVNVPRCILWSLMLLLVISYAWPIQIGQIYGSMWRSFTRYKVSATQLLRLFNRLLTDCSRSLRDSCVCVHPFCTSDHCHSISGSQFS